MRAALVCLALSLAGNAIAAGSQPTPKHTVSQQQPKANASAESASANDRGTQQSPLVVEVKAMPERTQEERDEQAAERHDKTDTDRWLVRLTAILAVATVLLVIATGFLWWSTKSLVKGAEETAERQLRAYVFVAESEIRNVGTNLIQAAVTIRNTGQTPAYDVTMSTKARAFNVPGEVVFEPTPISPDSSRFVFGPGAIGRRDIQLHTILGEPNAITALHDGLGVLFVYGEILYNDAFNRRQRTRFRHMIGGSAGWPSDNKMIVCTEGNDADQCQ